MTNPGNEKNNSASPRFFREGEGYRLTQHLTLPRPRGECFEYFSEPRNLEEITPDWLSLTVRECDPLPLQEGTRIRYRLWLHGFPLTWVSRVEQWDPPHLFRDVMVRGPYRRWDHLHRFEETGRGTTIEDVVRYELPFGWIGHRVHEWFVERDLRRIFSHRATVLQRRFGENPLP